jgi:putative membrane protein
MRMPAAERERNFHLGLLTSLALIFLWSAMRPYDRLTWFLEVFPAIVGVFLLAVTYERFRFSRLAYVMVWLHAMVLLVGGHYTYAEVPLFNWVREALELSRNNYDRVGHLAQGFFPAIVIREILLRLSPLKPGKWLFFIVTCTGLAISAFYELIEWWVALTSGDDAVAFLATQGDPWDTQWDMLLALIGVIVSQLLLGRIHDASMKRVAGAKPRRRR